MDVYQMYLAGLATFCAGLAYSRHHRRRRDDAFIESGVNVDKSGEREAVATFENDFFAVYLLAVGADWLQGPHIYALYRYEKAFAETQVAALYATGFVSGAISASFVGSWADEYGRRAACVVYCVVYSICCLTMLSDDFLVLLGGRVLGGVSTTLLFTVFETWMVSEYHVRGFDTTGLDLSSLFGKMTTLGSVVAVIAGIVGDVLVNQTGTRTTPFLASVCLLMGALAVMYSRWNENYGERSVTTSVEKPSGCKMNTILKDPRLCAIGLVLCVFEGTMYLFIFFWSGAMKHARGLAGIKEDPPYGLIFSCFMCSMMLGSMCFTYIVQGKDVKAASDLLLNIITLASGCLMLTIVLELELVTFWAFCVFEACIGAYFPAVGLIKSDVVADGVRGKVYGIFRLPLNIFVVTFHTLAEEGKW